MKSNFLQSLLFLFLLSSSISFSQGGLCGNGQINDGEDCDYGSGQFGCPPQQYCTQECTCQQGGSQSLSFNWLTQNQGWLSFSIIALVISISIVALAYMFGTGLNLPQLKAWAQTEFSQIFATALILVCIIGTFSFLSQFTYSLAESADFNCAEGSEPYAISVSKCYLDSLLSATDNAMKDNFRQAFENAKKSTERKGTSTVSKYTLWYSYYSGENAGFSMLTDRFSSNFDSLSGMYTSLYAQREFLDGIYSPREGLQGASLASVLLFYGIILRTFFFTRKLGGLLLAVGVSLLLVWPMLYAFSWATLKVSLFGDQVIAAQDEFCPAECMLSPPKEWQGRACEGTTGLCSQGGLDYKYLNELGEEVFGTGGVFTCPQICREIPYPVSIPECTKSDLIEQTTGRLAKNIDVRQLCSNCPDGCKVGGALASQGLPPARERTTCYQNPDGSNPQGLTPEIELYFGETACMRVDSFAERNEGCFVNGCSIKYSVNYNSESCETANHADCPDFCRIYYYDPANPTESDSWIIPSPETFPESQGTNPWEACSLCTLEKASFSCRFGMPNPDLLECNSLCTGCPESCKVFGLTEDEKTALGCQIAACDYSTDTKSGCPAYCKLEVPEPEGECLEYESNGQEAPAGCNLCPERCRVQNPGDLDPACKIAACTSEEFCPASCKAPAPTTNLPQPCDQCLSCDDDCATIPAIRTDCAERCNLPSAASQDFTPAGFISAGGAKTSQGGDLKTIGTLAIPAIVLPMFNIVLIIALVRVLSALLGGDMEIPGISRII